MIQNSFLGLSFTFNDDFCNFMIIMKSTCCFGLWLPMAYGLLLPWPISAHEFIHETAQDQTPSPAFLNQSEHRSVVFFSLCFERIYHWATNLQKGRHQPMSASVDFLLILSGTPCHIRNGFANLLTCPGIFGDLSICIIASNLKHPSPLNTPSHSLWISSASWSVGKILYSLDHLHLPTALQPNIPGMPCSTVSNAPGCYLSVFRQASLALPSGLIFTHNMKWPWYFTIRWSLIML